MEEEREEGMEEVRRGGRKRGRMSEGGRERGRVSEGGGENMQYTSHTATALQYRNKANILQKIPHYPEHTSAGLSSPLTSSPQRTAHESCPHGSGVNIVHFQTVPYWRLQDHSFTDVCVVRGSNPLPGMEQQGVCKRMEGREGACDDRAKD